MGERLEEREADATEPSWPRSSPPDRRPRPEQFARLVLAYEPVWAIGTGKTATAEIAAAAHQFLYAQMARAFGEDAAGKCRILYGGSVKPDNIKALMAHPDIDGALVGGASLDPAVSLPS